MNPTPPTQGSWMYYVQSVKDIVQRDRVNTPLQEKDYGIMMQAYLNRVTVEEFSKVIIVKLEEK